MATRLRIVSRSTYDNAVSCRNFQEILMRVLTLAVLACCLGEVNAAAQCPGQLRQAIFNYDTKSASIRYYNAGTRAAKEVQFVLSLQHCRWNFGEHNLRECKHAAGDGSNSDQRRSRSHGHEPRGRYLLARQCFDRAIIWPAPND